MHGAIAQKMYAGMAAGGGYSYLNTESIYAGDPIFRSNVGATVTYRSKSHKFLLSGLARYIVLGDTDIQLRYFSIGPTARSSFGGKLRMELFIGSMLNFPLSAKKSSDSPARITRTTDLALCLGLGLAWYMNEHYFVRLFVQMESSMPNVVYFPDEPVHMFSYPGNHSTKTEVGGQNRLFFLGLEFSRLISNN